MFPLIFILISLSSTSSAYFCDQAQYYISGREKENTTYDNAKGFALGLGGMGIFTLVANKVGDRVPIIKFLALATVAMMTSISSAETKKTIEGENVSSDN